MTYFPSFSITPTTPILAEDVSVTAISNFTKVIASDVSVADLTSISTRLHTIDISNVTASFTTVVSGVTYKLLGIPV